MGKKKNELDIKINQIKIVKKKVKSKLKKEEKSKN